MQLRDYRVLGTTQSQCPECLSVVPAKIIDRDGRVYFKKRCPTHGIREDFVCSDVSQFDQMEFSLPAKIPPRFGVEPDRGCPLDCGLCTDHEQHTCIGLVEITSSCNLRCPTCYASSGPGGKHLSFEECTRSIDRLVQVEGRPEVLQISGGEPTIHPDFTQILDYGCKQPIDYVMVNTNGLRFAHDDDLMKFLADRRNRIEVYFQFDGFSDSSSIALRGESLVDTKLKAIETLGKHGINTTLVATLQAGVNEDQIGRIVQFGLERPWIAGVSFQPATYSGRFVLPEALERRITFPDVIRAVCEQTGLFEAGDFMPLPCAHPNCHSITYAYRSNGRVVPLQRFLNGRANLDLLANGITFTRPRARALIEQYLGKQGCCAGGECGPTLPNTELVQLANGNGHSSGASSSIADEFFRKALAEDLYPRDVFRVTITSFLDAYNFDVRRVMKCCIHHVLPSGHVIPFCAYNVLYRDGHVPMPVLRDTVTASANPLSVLSGTCS